MAEEKSVVLKEGEVVVSQSTLDKILKGQEESDQKIAELEANIEGVKELGAFAATNTEKLREKPTKEPKFRTVRLRQYQMAGKHDDLGWVVGWSNRGAYELVDRSGIAPVIVNMIDIQFLGHEKSEDGKLKFEAVPILSLFNRGIQTVCKIVDTKRNEVKVPTGEEIEVLMYDSQHGLRPTGEKIDGWVSHSEISYLVEVPGHKEPVWIDAKFVN